MEMSSAVTALQALGQPTRLMVFRLLLSVGSGGLAAGEVGRQLSVRANTLSAHLAVLQAAGLVTATRDGRFITYAADMPGLRGLMTWLLQDCCGGNPEICAPVLDRIAHACRG
jgi:ArsR family transcriptional regulator, arsenate/arsenite/antimonite-responsive transcriptional repressor